MLSERLLGSLRAWGSFMTDLPVTSDLGMRSEGQDPGHLFNMAVTPRRSIVKQEETHMNVIPSSKNASSANPSPIPAFSYLSSPITLTIPIL
jgi:hypothetical protein